LDKQKLANTIKLLPLGMQESWELSINSPARSKELGKLIQDLLEENEKELGIFLSYYFKKEGAVTEKVKLHSIPLFKEKLKGNFLVSFDLVHFNACLNIHEQSRNQMELGFEFDPNLTTLHLTGPYWPEREMDEI
jgi:hypothetical protein